MGDRDEIQWLYCMVFDYTEEITGDRKAILEKVVRAGLHIEQFYSVQKDEVLVKIGASDDRLLDEAEHNEFLLPLDPASIESIAKSSDFRDDVIKDRKTGEIKKTLQRKRGPLPIVEPKGRRFTNAVKPSVNIGQDKLAVKESFADMSAAKHGHVLLASEVEKVQGKLTPYTPFEHLYCPYDQDDEEYFLAAHNGLQIYQVYADGSILSGHHRMKLLHMTLERSVTPDPRTGMRGAGLSIPQLLDSDIAKAVYPLHLETTLTNREGTITTLDLGRKWSSFKTVPWRQPLNDVRDYFGEQVALYFAFLGHLSVWLSVPAFFGLIVFCRQMYRVAMAYNDVADAAAGTSVTFDPFSLSGVEVNSGNVTINIFTIVPELPYFSAFIALWATVVLEFWKRKERTLAMLWGTSNFEKDEVTRVEFKPLYELPSIVTGAPEMYYPWKTTMMKLAISTVVVFISITSVATVVVLLTSLSSLIRSIGDIPEDEALPTYITVVALFVDAILKILMSTVYHKIARSLNDWENHRTDTKYYDSLILKTFIFEVMNRFGTLFYLAFVKPNVDLFADGDYCIPFSEEIISQSGGPPADNCFGTVGYALLAAFGSALVVGNVNEIVMPRLKAFLTRRANAVKSNVLVKGATDAVGTAANAMLDVVGLANEEGSDEEESGPAIMKSPCEDDFYLGDYEGTMDDFLEIAILFGYSTMFVAAFPLAPCMAFANSFIETRVDSLKLCTYFRRPEVKGAQDIGPWQTVFEVMGIAAVVTNAAVILFSTDVYEFEHESNRVWTFLLSVTFVFAFKWAFAIMVNDTPLPVSIQLARNEYIIRKLIRREPDDMPEDDAELDKYVQKGLQNVANDKIHNADPGIRKLLRRVGELLRSQMEQNDIVALFAKLDGDGSGEIDGKEFSKVLRQHSEGVSEYDARRIVSALDIDGDGKVDYDEFATFVASLDKVMERPTSALQPRAAQKSARKSSRKSSRKSRTNSSKRNSDEVADDFVDVQIDGEVSDSL